MRIRANRPAGKNNSHYLFRNASHSLIQSQTMYYFIAYSVLAYTSSEFWVLAYSDDFCSYWYHWWYTHRRSFSTQVFLRTLRPFRGARQQDPQTNIRWHEVSALFENSSETAVSERAWRNTTINTNIAACTYNTYWKAISLGFRRFIAVFSHCLCCHEGTTKSLHGIRN